MEREPLHYHWAYIHYTRGPITFRFRAWRKKVWEERPDTRVWHVTDLGMDPHIEPAERLEPLSGLDPEFMRQAAEDIRCAMFYYRASDTNSTPDNVVVDDESWNIHLA
jgi:hypothetical protein